MWNSFKRYKKTYNFFTNNNFKELFDLSQDNDLEKK